MELALITYARHRRPEGVATNNRTWTQDHGKGLVKGLVDGISPNELKQEVPRGVEFENVRDPERAFDIMEVRGEKEALREELAAEL